MRVLAIALLLFSLPLLAEEECSQLVALGSLDQRHPKFADLGLVDPCTGRANLCGPVSAVNGLPRILNRTIPENEAIGLVDLMVRGSGIALQDAITRGFWPFELKQALDRFFASQEVPATAEAKGVHAFAENWNAGVFAAHAETRELPTLNELSDRLKDNHSFTMVNFLGFVNEDYAMTKFDPKQALDDFKQGRIFMAHYLTADRVLELRQFSIVVSGRDPLNGQVEFELIPFIHPAFGSRIYRMKYLKPESNWIFLTSALIFAHKN